MHEKKEVTTNQPIDRTFMSNGLECVYVYHKSIYSQWMRVLSLRPYFQYLLLSRTHCAWIVLDPSARFLSTLYNSFFLRVNESRCFCTCFLRFHREKLFFAHRRLLRRLSAVANCLPVIPRSIFFKTKLLSIPVFLSRSYDSSQHCLTHLKK